MLQVGLMGVIILLGATIANVALFVLFSVRYRREITWRDARIEALVGAVRNNEIYTLELQRRCERYRRMLPGPCFEEYDTDDGGRLRAWLN